MLNWYDMRNDVLLLAHELSDYGYLPTKRNCYISLRSLGNGLKNGIILFENDNSMDGFDRRTVKLKVNKDE